MTNTALFDDTDPSRSVFTGADICSEAGLSLPDSTRHPIFEDDLWDFTEVVGLPTQMPISSRRFDFTIIVNTEWRLVAKEQIMAMLAPRHQAAAWPPRGYRTPLHLTTAFGRLAELARFFNWLTSCGVTSLAEVDSRRCEAYLAHRRYLLDEHGVVIGERGPATRRVAAQVIVDLVNHRELFSSDRVPEDLRPWGGVAPSIVAEVPRGIGQNKTLLLHDSVLQPMLAAASYLVDTLGPHAIELSRRISEADRKWSVASGSHVATSVLPTTEIAAVLADYEHRGEPLPLLAGHDISKRIAAGWSPDDPLTSIGLGMLARQAGCTQFLRDWVPHLRSQIEATLRVVGAEKPFGRFAATVDRADGEGVLAWTLPLDRLQAVGLVRIVRTAAIIVVAAVSGMRSSELMELGVGCCLPPEHFGPGLVRYRLAGKVVKGQPLGGTADQWVVIEPAYRAAELLEHFHENPQPGAPLLARFTFGVRYTWFRNWVSGPSGQRLGLASIPESPVTLRALRRTLAIELAFRPGGVLATKIHLKHISVVTSEGYASRPGGAQAELLAEVNKYESERNLELVWAEFRNYQQGILPAGPGARELTELFAHIDGKLTPAGAPQIQSSDRDVLNLMTKRAETLHLGVANYCWFTDPSRALCLKLAGTPHGKVPLAGMCDSARCPQATHHPCHRPVWSDHAHQTKVFLSKLGSNRKTERARLEADHDRAQRVVSAIDAATDSQVT